MIRLPRIEGSARACAMALGVMTVTAALQGCATAQNPDPIEPWNRKVFAFNESLDEHVLKPVASGYSKVTPEPVRTAFTNFAGNLKDAWSTINLFLQGRFADGTLGIIRVTVNSTFGLAGLIDIATPMQLPKPNEDFGQTLGVWGVKPGAYIVWPVLGPSTLRDSVSIPGDLYFTPSTLATYPRERNLLAAWQVVNTRANLLNASNLLNDVALDKYAFIRDAYLQRRQSLIHDAETPDEDEHDDVQYAPQDEPAAPSPGASAPQGSPPAQSAPASPGASAPLPAASGPVSGTPSGSAVPDGASAQPAAPSSSAASAP